MGREKKEVLPFPTALSSQMKLLIKELSRGNNSSEEGL